MVKHLKLFHILYESNTFMIFPVFKTFIYRAWHWLAQHLFVYLIIKIIPKMFQESYMLSSWSYPCQFTCLTHKFLVTALMLFSWTSFLGACLLMQPKHFFVSNTFIIRGWMQRQDRLPHIILTLTTWEVMPYADPSNLKSETRP